NPLPKAGNEIRERQSVLYDIDQQSAWRKSTDNTDVWGLYDDLLGEPGSHTAHNLLHTHFANRQVVAGS
ncbi:MAG: iron hydrogenase small subunit, partial [Cellulomonadaceae bacterium]|nr:iron hydrogenase small subunit [Cellulomonadaceae bacterium]